MNHCPLIGGASFDIIVPIVHGPTAKAAGAIWRRGEWPRGKRVVLTQGQTSAETLFQSPVTLLKKFHQMVKNRFL